MEPSRNWKRRAVAGAAAVVAGLIVAGAAAFACTQRVGTFTVCSPASSKYVKADCAKITGTTQSGALSVGNGAGFSAQATKFKNKVYQVTFLAPGGGSSCHRTTSGGQILTSTSGADRFRGPSWYAEFTLPTVNNTGAAKICSQDVPDVVTGQVIDLTIV